ncbi:MAG: polyamine aminopropyltransferase [Sandaracinaceae bacterium]
MALWYDEVFDDALRTGLRVRRTLYAAQSPFQRIEIVETPMLGKVLVLDGIFMTSVEDEFFYHEMIVHPVLTSARRIQRVLVIGGGDGGTVREVLRHPEVERCTMVEIDEAVVRACQEHLPEIGTSWSDPRLDLRFEDGVAFVREWTGEPFDVVLLDGSDPVGPALGLFDKSFYEGVRRVLREGGLFGLQSETPTVLPQVFFAVQETLRDVFEAVHPYFGSVLLYGGGMWTWTVASTDGAYDPRAFDERRVARVETTSRYYNRDIHRAAFAVPTFVRRRLDPDAAG